MYLRMSCLFEREYFVPRYKSKVLLKASRLLISTTGIVSVSIDNLRTRVANKIRVFVDSIRKR